MRVTGSAATVTAAGGRLGPPSTPDPSAGSRSPQVARDGAPGRRDRPVVEDRSGAEASRPSVLLVEDEEDLRRVVRRYLELSGEFTIFGEAGHGAEALERVSRDDGAAPDIVLLDLVMPTMDGWEALPRLVRRLPTTMVVVLSALDAALEEGRALHAGAFAYVEKTAIGPGFTERLLGLHRDFLRALGGETVWSPQPRRT